MRIILTGFGAVGQNLAKILRDENERFVHSYGFKPSIVAVSDSRGYCIDENGLDLITLLKTKEGHGTVARYPGKGEKDAGTKSIINEVDRKSHTSELQSRFDLVCRLPLSISILFPYTTLFRS